MDSNNNLLETIKALKEENELLRAQLEKEKSSALKFYQTIIKSAPIGLAIFDENLHIIDCNEEMLKICDTSKQHYIDHFLEFLPEYQPDGQKSLDKAIGLMKSAITNGNFIKTEWLNKTAKGEPVPCELIITCIEHDNSYTGLAFIYDLRNTEKMKVEINRAARINRAILEAMPVGIAIFDSTSKIIDCNDELVRMFDAPKQQILNRYYEDFTPVFLPDGRVAIEEALKLTNRAAAGETIKLEWPHQTAKGEPVPCDITLTHVKDADEFTGIGFLYDLRNIKKLTKELEDALLRATAASEAKSHFLSNMSHEIRTPMNAIIGMTVIGKSADDIKRKNYCFEKIENASQHLLGVINDVLDMSKIEANKFELSNVDFDFEKTLQRVVNIISFRADEKKQKLTVHIDNSIPRSLTGDDQRLAQVITNLLGNAVKFTPEEGSIRLDTRFLREEDGVYTIRISVKDSGIGINKEQQQQLFHSFQQAESGTSRRFGGTGLGLVISKSIVEMMGGSIGLESEPGKGSTFSFTFKAKRGTKKTLGLSETGVKWDNVKILAVDDDREILDYFEEILKGFGTICDTASSGQEALALVGVNGIYDIYFIDWKMPDMDGILLAKELKEKSKSPDQSVVIMISAAEWSGIADEAKKAGIDKFLSKPLFPSAIADTITEAIGLNHLPEDINLSYSGIFKGYKVLLAEDVEINREIVKSLVEHTLLELDFAENGCEAVEMFSNSPEAYDLILMDIQMPEMDGYEATRRIRALNQERAKTIPIIAMTANVFREDIEKCLEAGMNDHVGKPFDSKEFFDTLRRYISEKKL